jgi:hypothetical protein
MALEGNIKEFGVTDILQLISQQQKSGILTVEQEDQKVEIYFVEGQVAGTRSSSRTVKDTLGDILVRAKLLSPQDQKRALNIQKETLEYLGEILIKNQLVSKRDLTRAILSQTYETCYDIFQWKEGSYQFNPRPARSCATLAPVMSVDALILDVLRMIDEWPEVHATITSFDLIFQTVSEINPQDHTKEELLVLSLSDGQRTTQQIIDESLLGRFQTCKIFVGLLQKGSVVQISSSKVVQKASTHWIARQPLVATVSYGVLCLVIAVLLLLPTSPLRSYSLLANTDNSPIALLQQYQDNILLLRLEKALGVYLIRNGTYPRGLHELISKAVLSENDLELQKGQTILYRLERDSYILRIDRQRDPSPHKKDLPSKNN